MAACGVEVCRICFSMDCQLHLLHKNMKLYKAYEEVTELALADEEDLPPYLCSSCADQLMNCARFRHRSLQAHLVLLDILKKHDHISVESIHAIKTTHSDSNNKETEEERIFSDLKIDVKLEDVPEDPIAIELGDENKTEYIPDDAGVNNNDLFGDKDNVAPWVVEANDIVKAMLDETPVNNNVDDSKLTTVFKIPSKNAVYCKSYRKRKKTAAQIIKTPPNTDAEKTEMFSMPTKLLAQASIITANEVLFTPSTSNSQMTFEPSPQACSNGEDVSSHGLEDLSSAQKDKLNMVETREGKEVTKDLNQKDVIRPQFEEVDVKPLENVKLSSDLCGHENHRAKRFIIPLQSHAETTINCSKCEFKTESKKYIMAHMTLHSGSMTQSINPGRSYSRISSQINNLSKEFSCDICNKSYRSKKGLERHKLIHTDSEQYKCDLCCKSYSEKGSLKNHLQTHVGYKPFSCNICKNSFTKKRSLENHMLLHSDDKQYKCNVCDKSYYQKGSLQYHLQTHVGDRPFECNVCKNSFTKKGSLKSHMLIHTGVKPYTCDLCKKTFRQKSNLKFHLRQHSGHKPFLCEICQKKFSRKFCLQNHMLIHTGEKPFKCDVCTKSFHQKINLQMHVLKHVDEKPFKCNMCDKSFNQKYCLKMHVLTHSGVRPYTCDVCKFSFRAKSTLQSHILTHSDTKPHSCYICEKSFRQKSYLRHHMLVHTALRPFSCEICKKSFREKSHLHRHMLTHNDKKLFSCDVCKTSFRQKSYLQKHVIKHWR